MYASHFTHESEIVVPRDNDFRSGVKAAVACLQSWQARDDTGVTPDQMLVELLAVINGRIGEHRSGFSVTVMTFIMGCLQGGVPSADDLLELVCRDE